MRFYSRYNIDPLWCWEWLPSSWVKLKILWFQHLCFVCTEIYIYKRACRPGCGNSSVVKYHLMVKRLQVWVLEGAAGDFSSLGSTFCADSYVSICFTPVAGKRSWSFCQKCRWQVAAKHTCTLHLWLQMKWHYKQMHGCPVYTEWVPKRQQVYVAPAVWQPNSTVSTPVQRIFKMRCMWPVTH